MATLSPLDASFLLLERLWLPMHYSGLSILDPRAAGRGPVTQAELRRSAARRLHRLPRFRQRVEFPFRGLGHPVWTPAKPDLDRHFGQHTLPDPGSWSQLMELSAQLHAEPLDRARPLWELHLIDGLAGGRQALLMKVHHSIADGIGGVEVATALYDRQPSTPTSSSRSPRPEPPPTPTWLAVLQVLVGSAQWIADGLLAPGSFFNRPVGPRRAFATARLDPRLLVAAKHVLGVTVDDMLVEVVAAGIARYLAEQGDSAPGRLRAMLPVSTRTPGEAGGNHVSAMFLDVPLTGGPEAIAAEVARAKGRLRRAHQALALETLVALAGRLPEPLHAAAVGLATSLPTANLVISDIPGPAQPYTLLGVPVVAMYPLMPLAPGTGLSVAALWVGGTVGIGVTADPAQVRHPERLAAAIETAASELPRRRATRRVRPGPPRGSARRGRRSAPRYAPAPRAASASRSGSARRPPR